MAVTPHLPLAEAPTRRSAPSPRLRSTEAQIPLADAQNPFTISLNLSHFMFI